MLPTHLLMLPLICKPIVPIIFFTCAHKCKWNDAKVRTQDPGYNSNAMIFY